MYGYAWYKLAYVFWNQGDLPHALDAFKKTIDFGTNYAQLPNAAKLAESARKDVIPVYALAGNPTDAYNFFKNLSGDQAGSNDKTFKMMDDLGQNYLDTGHYPEAIALYKDLKVRDSGSDKSCEYQSHITEATMAMKSGDKIAIVNELNNQFKTLRPVQAGKPQGRGQAEVREPHRGARDRDGDGVAPRGRRLAGPARHRRPEDDGPRVAPLQEGGRHLDRGRVLEVRVPAPGQGRLAHDLQDQIQHGRPALLPRAVGRLRSRVRRGRRGGPEGRGRGQRRVRRGALLPEHLPRARTPTAPTRRGAATSWASVTTSSRTRTTSTSRRT